MSERLGHLRSDEAARLRLSRSDVEMLDFIVRLGCASRMSLMKRRGEDRAEVVDRGARLRGLGLINIQEGRWDGDTLHAPTKAGARSCSRDDLFDGVRRRAEHLAIVAELAACEERLGARTVSSREAFAMGGEEARSFSAVLPTGRLHRCDLIVLPHRGRPEAVEVEVVPRDPERLDGLMRAWADAVADGRLGGVSWRCDRAVLPGAEAALELAGAHGSVAVRGLWR